MIRLTDLYRIVGRRLTRKLLAAGWIVPIRADERGVAFDTKKVHRALGRLTREGDTLLARSESIFCAIPFVWLILASFDGNASLFLRWPSPWTLNNYIGIFVREGGARWFFNSFLVVGTATIIVLVFAGLGGYALSRTKAWWKRPFLYAIILVRVVPPPALIVPLYKLLLTGNDAIGAFVRRLVNPESVRQVMLVVGLINGYFGLILVFAAMQLPLALWIMKTYFDAIPHDYEEAALVDGANLFQRIRLVLAPLALPGLGAAGLLHSFPPGEISSCRSSCCLHPSFRCCLLDCFALFCASSRLTTAF